MNSKEKFKLMNLTENKGPSVIVKKFLEKKHIKAKLNIFNKCFKETLPFISNSKNELAIVLSDVGSENEAEEELD